MLKIKMLFEWMPDTLIHSPCFRQTFTGRVAAWLPFHEPECKASHMIGLASSF